MSTFLNFAVEYLNAFAALGGTLDPVSMLYGLLAGTYASAAVAATANDHHALVRCYLASAVLHELIGVVHHLGF
jgi:hypothetical protein